MDRLQRIASLPARYPQQFTVLGVLFGIWAFVNFLAPRLAQLGLGQLVAYVKTLAGIQDSQQGGTAAEEEGQRGSSSWRNSWPVHAMVLGGCTTALILGLYSMRVGGVAAQQRRLEQRNAAAARARRDMQEQLEQQALRRAQEQEAERERQQQLREAEKQAGEAVVGGLQQVAKTAAATERAAVQQQQRQQAAAPAQQSRAPAAAPAVARSGVALSGAAVEAARQHRYDAMQRQATEAAAKHAQEEAARAAQAQALRQQAAAATAAAAQAAQTEAPTTAVAARAEQRAALNPAGGSSGSLQNGGGGAGGGSSRGMVSREAALEAEARQQQWLQQLNTQADPSARLNCTLEQERAIRQQQDAEYFASLNRDQERAAAVASGEEQRKAKARRILELAAVKQQLRAALPPEPSAPADTEGDAPAAGGGPTATTVTVRVRMPDGSSHTRRWAAAAAVAQVYDWVQSLDACPLWEPEEWRLAMSYPRAVLAREEARAVGEVAGGEPSLVLMVERV